MKINVQGTWEAERIATLLAAMATPWAHDCAARIRQQVEEARESKWRGENEDHGENLR